MASKSIPRPRAEPDVVLNPGRTQSSNAVSALEVAMSDVNTPGNFVSIIDSVETNKSKRGRTMSDRNIASGAEALRDLLRRIHAATEQQLATHYADGEDDGTDARDYPAIAALIATSIEENLAPSNGQAHRDGYLLALSEILCLSVDGCGINLAEWAPAKQVGLEPSRAQGAGRAETLRERVPVLLDTLIEVLRTDAGDSPATYVLADVARESARELVELSRG